MQRKINIIGITLFFTLALFSLAFGQEESFTITTYYPSPYGSYDEIRTNKMVIGDLDSSTTPTPSPGAITFNPRTPPVSYSEGTLYYDITEHKFKYRDNANWKDMGGSALQCVGKHATNLGYGGCSATVSCGSGYIIVWAHTRLESLRITPNSSLYPKIDCVGSTTCNYTYGPTASPEYSYECDVWISCCK